MSDMTMVERVAHALSGTLDGDDPEEARKYYIAVARTAIEAMREPTDAMLEATWAKLHANISDADFWSAMIDAALSEQKP